MYLDKEELERIRKEGEEYSKQKEKESHGSKYISEAKLQIYCLHCKHEFFELGKALLNTRGMSFLDLDWLNENATTLICKHCGYIHWFNKNVIEMRVE